ncbi:hypothetical protein [Streptomyces sp. NPDC057580]|uniref:hypothetical protein n=1 Tax=Streptomyces sp. NPDC057580 TaxID=3346173 RepID=UPI0036B1D5AE
MKNYRLKWTEDGKERTSVVSYNLTSAEERKQELVTEGHTDAAVVEVSIFGGKS